MKTIIIIIIFLINSITANSQTHKELIDNRFLVTIEKDGDEFDIGIEDLVNEVSMTYEAYIQEGGKLICEDNNQFVANIKNEKSIYKATSDFFISQGWSTVFEKSLGNILGTIAGFLCCPDGLY